MNSLSLFRKIQIILGDDPDLDLMYHFALSVFTGSKEPISYKQQEREFTWWGYDPKDKMLFQFNTRDKVYDRSLVDIIMYAEKLCDKNGYYFIGPQTSVLTEHIMNVTLKVLDLECNDSIYTYKILE